MTTIAPTIAAPSNSLTCSTQQLLEIIGVLASNVTVPFKNANATGLIGTTNPLANSNNLQFPDNALNQLFASQISVDCNNTVPGNIIISGSPSFTTNNPIPADGPFGAGVSVSVLTTLQLMECIAVLRKELTRPYPFANQTGLFLNGANQHQFPDTFYNQNVGFNLNPWTDGVFIYIPTSVGWPSSGI